MQDEEQTNAKDTRAHSCVALIAHLVKHAPHVQRTSLQ